MLLLDDQIKRIPIKTIDILSIPIGAEEEKLKISISSITSL